MNRFHIIDDAAVILRTKGVFRQAKVFRWGEELFAQHGPGFIKLYPRGGTSHPQVSWLDMELPAGAAWLEEGISALRLPAASLRAVIDYKPEVAA